MTLHLSNTQARRVFLNRHLLDRPPIGRGANLHDTLRKLGFVQFDSINTLARAHDLILWSRQQSYRPRDLRKHADQDRLAFETWTHDAALVPMEYYPHWRHKFDQDAARLAVRWSSWRRGDFESLLGQVRDQVAKNGPVCSSDVGQSEVRSKGGWWDWHPSKTALEYLWRSGELAVCHRSGIKKFYDLAENVVPRDVFEARTTWAETRAWACLGALDRLGVATAKEIADFWDIMPLAEVKVWVEAALKSGQLSPVIVDDHLGAPIANLVARTDQLPDLAEPRAGPSNRVRILSPFDPMLRNRKRALALFGFDYKIEIFVPAAKRKYAYYVFPVLEGTRLIGRIDVSVDSKTQRLNVRRFWPEAGIVMSPAREARLHKELLRLLPFTGATELVFER